MFNSISLLAAGGITISVLFMVIAFISWLWNVFNGNQNGPAAGRGPQGQPGGKRVETELQAEINRFLKNVLGQKDEGKAEQLDELEVIEEVEEEEQPRRRPTAPNKRGNPKRKNVAASKREESDNRSESRPGGRISERKGPGTTNLGSGLRQHVADHMQEGRVLQGAQQHFAHGVAEKVQQDLGVFTGVAPAGDAAIVTTSRQTATAISVAKLVRDPVTLKEAFVLNLVLTRPNFGKRFS